MHFQDGLAPLHVRAIHDHLPIETTGAQQRGVKNVRPVGGGNDDDIGVRVKAIHLNQDLIERLLALVMTAAQACAAMATHGVNLVNEDDARAVALGLLEEIAHAAGANAHEHLDKFRTGNREEGHARFTRHGLGHQRLARARRAHHQHALGDARAQSGKFLRFLEELDHFLQLLFGFIGAGHIRKRHRGFVAGEHARAALAKSHGLVVAALRLAQQEKEERTNEDQGQQAAQEGEPISHIAWRLHAQINEVELRSGHTEADQLFCQTRRRLLARNDHLITRLAGLFDCILTLYARAHAHLVADNGHGCYFTLFDPFGNRRNFLRFNLAGLWKQAEKKRNHSHQDE